MNPDNLGLATFLKRIDATKGNLAILPVQARSAQEIDKAFAAMSRERIGAVVMPQDSFFVQQQSHIVGLAARNRLPLVTQFRSYVEAGGLVSYGPDIADQWRRSAMYVDKIFKGAKPADLPVEQPTKLEMFINRKTAKAQRLGGLAVDEQFYCGGLLQNSDTENLRKLEIDQHSRFGGLLH